MSSSAITKRAIASAFEELLEVTPLEQITVSAIAERTGINRQTFYYHFHDIYELRSGASPGTPMVRRRTHPTSSTVRS
jgi:AcrR family transcriptional regulator